MGDAHASMQISVDPGLDIYMFINLSLKNGRMFDFILSDKLYLLCIVFLHYPQYKYSDINANAFTYLISHLVIQVLISKVFDLMML